MILKLAILGGGGGGGGGNTTVELGIAYNSDSRRYPICGIFGVAHKYVSYSTVRISVHRRYSNTVVVLGLDAVSPLLTKRASLRRQGAPGVPGVSWGQIFVAFRCQG